LGLTDLFKEKLEGVHQTIGYINSLVAEYEPMQAILAFEKILDSNPAWKLKIVGFGPKYKALADYIKENNLDKNILLYGPLSNQEIYDVFKRVDIIVVPASYYAEEDKTENISLLGSAILIHHKHQLLSKLDDSGIIPFSHQTEFVLKLDETIRSINHNNSSENRANRISKLGS